MKSIKKIAAELSSNTIAAAKRALKEARMKQKLLRAQPSCTQLGALVGA